MRITVFGGTGTTGRHIIHEALARGHKVTAVVRSQSRAASLPEDVNWWTADLMNSEPLAHSAENQDLVISALRPTDGNESSLVKLTQSVLSFAADAKVRAIVMGGAARLRVPTLDGETVLSAPGFLPDSVIPIAQACWDQYLFCVNEAPGNWTYISPPAQLMQGPRTGTYRVGSDSLLTDEQGNSRISLADFAAAMLDEGEAPKHIRQAFTVGY